MADEALVYPSRIAVPYTWSAGLVGTKFFIALKERRKFLASRCPVCKKTYLPPLKTCGVCFKPCREGVEVGPRGTLISYTAALYKTPAQPRENPIYGLIRLDGVDTSFLHLLGDVALKDLKAGIKVEPVFKEDGSMAMWGISHFRPVEGP